MKKLSVGRCSIRSLKNLIPPFHRHNAAAEILSMKSFEKSSGFTKLTDLNISQNLIESLDGLIGVVFLPNLQNLLLEGNPVMSLFIPRALKSKKRLATKGTLRNRKFLIVDDFDLHEHFKVHYGIFIADPCYTPQQKLGKILTSLCLRNRKNKGSKGHGNPKNIRVSSESMQNPLAVFELPKKVSDKIKDKTEKRHYNFTDQDLEEIVKKGKIPSVKSLMKLAEVKRTELEASVHEEKVRTAEKIEDFGADLSEEPERTPLQLNSEISYNPEYKDDTFLTGVHITGNIHEIESKAIPAENSEPEPNEEDAIEENIPDIDFQLPSNIVNTTKALRQALKNPGSYWRSIGYIMRPPIEKGLFI